MVLDPISRLNPETVDVSQLTLFHGQSGLLA